MTSLGVEMLASCACQGSAVEGGSEVVAGEVIWDQGRSRVPLISDGGLCGGDVCGLGLVGLRSVLGWFQWEWSRSKPIAVRS